MAVGNLIQEPSFNGSFEASSGNTLLHHLIDSATEYAIFMLDQEGKIARWNSGAERILQYREDEILGRSAEIFFTPEDTAKGAPLQELDVARNTGASHHDRWQVRKDGTRFWANGVVMPIWDDQSNLLGFSKVIRDNTERNAVVAELKACGHQLVRSQAELEQFAYVASHDLKEPLRMVTSYLQLLKRRYETRLDSSADDYIHFAVDGAKRMHRLINDLLHYTQVGSQATLNANVDVNSALDDALRNLTLAIEESGAEITRDPLPTLCGTSRPLLTQLLKNLLSNAIKFRGERVPKIHVGAKPSGDNWLFFVSDNGIGIAPEFADKIFIIFQRLHAKKAYSGSGIGLAICKKIVEHHGGRIWFESIPGDGTVFYFELPCRERRADPLIRVTSRAPKESAAKKTPFS